MNTSSFPSATPIEKRFYLDLRLSGGKGTFDELLEQSEVTPIDLGEFAKFARTEERLMTADEAAHRIGISRARFDRARKRYGLKSIENSDHEAKGRARLLYRQSEVDNMGDELAFEDPVLGFRMGWRDMLEGNTVSTSELMSALKNAK